MSGLYFKEGNILDADEDIICHQCNCKSLQAAGLAKALFEKYPEADIYKLLAPEKRSVSSVFFSDLNDGKLICHMFAQIYPGKPQWGIDSREKRLKYFRNCLDRLIFSDSGRDVTGYAFPYKVGCGMAGGIWDQYLKEIKKFSKHIKSFVTIYCHKKIP